MVGSVPARAAPVVARTRGYGVPTLPQIKNAASKGGVFVRTDSDQASGLLIDMIQ